VSRRHIAGVDEAGRGPLAGSVFAAAVILNPARTIAGLKDSKKLTATKREALALEIKSHALAWAIAEASAGEIDTHNILQATMLAMQRAVAALSMKPVEVWVDGNRAPKLGIACKTFVKGDALYAEISAASILAKTARDASLLALEQAYPGYGFAQHKGYPTPEHFAALNKLGPCPAHRQSFAPVRAAKAPVAEAAPPQGSLW
jgi:ribonuclease HII